MDETLSPYFVVEHTVPFLRQTHLMFSSTVVDMFHL